MVVGVPNDVVGCWMLMLLIRVLVLLLMVLVIGDDVDVVVVADVASLQRRF